MDAEKSIGGLGPDGSMKDAWYLQQTRGAHPKKFLDRYLHPECKWCLTIKAPTFEHAARLWIDFRSNAGHEKPTTPTSANT